MDWLIFPSLAFAPGAFWLWFFARKDRYRPEPKKLIALTFGLGMISTLPVLGLHFLFVGDSVFEPDVQLSETVIRGLFVAAAIEELAKFSVVWLGAYRTLHFDEPSDGLVYGAAASLGFASLENLFYVFSFGPGVMIGRAPLSTVAHVIFGCCWGYALGRSKQSGVSRMSGMFGIFAGILVASIAHALFNVSVSWPPTIVAVLVMVPLGIWWVLRRFDWANSVSPFRLRRNYPQINCQACGNSISVISHYCRFCGESVDGRDYELACSRCRTVNRSDADYCTRCGDRFVFGEG